jgi:DNA helicase-2/ATP-dependent DNA helicase PcrA
MDFLKDLNPEQAKAVTFGNGPLLILAGAGSGKTRALTYRASYLVSQKNIAPESILLVTFTNKAAAEMKKRISRLITTNLPFAGTFHSFCVRILKKEGHRINIQPNFVIYDAQDQLDTVKNAIAQLSLPNLKPGPVLGYISQAKNELISELEYPQYARSEFGKAVSQVYLVYQKLLNKYNALDFDDLLFKTVKLFKSDQQLLTQYQDQFRYILVDEYQDTNKAQYELTKLLAKSHKNITVVGDCSQSIYSWRGADFRNIMRLQEDYPNLTTISLERNYRSHQIILDAAFAVISKNKSHPILKLWTQKKKGNPITLYQASDEKDEARFIVKKINFETALEEKYNQFAVLYRTNAQSRVIEESFLHAGIPYILVGGTRFYDRKEIKDCLAMLRLLVNPLDMISFQRIEKIGKNRLKKFLEFSEKFTIDDKKTFDILNLSLDAINFLEMFDRENEEDLSRLENIKELFSVAQQFPKLDEFLENVALIEKENRPRGNKNDPNNAVTLMTLHAAKGLEFDTVFMIGMEEGLFPHSRCTLDKSELEEERRLCYVGITRARENLYMTHTASRLYFGHRNSNDASRFIVDLPEQIIKLEYA